MLNKKILASKYLIDEGETDEIYNYEWAKAADLPVKRLNCLERQFLARLNWDLFVSADEFWEFTGHLTERYINIYDSVSVGNGIY